MILHAMIPQAALAGRPAVLAAALFPADDPGWLKNASVYVVQWLILALGLYFFLTFLRRTRGNRLVRGLVATLLLGLVILWAVSDFFQLQELEYVVRGLASAAIVVLAIVFQPELRSAIGQLGAKKRLRDRAGRVAPETLSELAESARNLARKRIGALIVVEGEQPLDQWVENAARTDAAIDRLIVESIFHPGSALHDGAMVVRGDRLLASAVMLPLTERTDLHRSTGTRHRAALGLSEQTDAVALVVSEETGNVSIAHAGTLESEIPPAEVEAAMRRALGAHSPRQDASHSLLADLAALWKRLTGDVAVLGLSALIALGILFFVHDEISVDDERELTFRWIAPDSTAQPEPGQVLLRQPGELWVPEEREQKHTLAVRGTRAAVERFTTQAGAEFVWPAGETSILLTDPYALSWTVNPFLIELDWVDQKAPRFSLAEIDEREIELVPGHVALDDIELGGFYSYDSSKLRFSPSSVVLQGRSAILDELQAVPPRRRLFEDLRLNRERTSDEAWPLVLAADLDLEQVRLVDPDQVEALLEVAPTERFHGEVLKELALVCMDPARQSELDDWVLPTGSLSVGMRITTRALLSNELEEGTEEYLRAVDQIHRYVEQNLLVFVDLAEITPGSGSRSLPVRYSLRRPWETELFPRLNPGAGAPAAHTDLKLEFAGEDQVLLEPSASHGADAGAEGSGPPAPPFAGTFGSRDEPR